MGLFLRNLLSRLELKKNNLDALGPDIIEKITMKLNVKEVLELCSVSRSFKSLCWKESFWRLKIKSDFGINKRYENTWKDTAKQLFENNVINLDKKWVNGQTYRTLMNGAFDGNDDSKRQFYSIVTDATVGMSDETSELFHIFLGELPTYEYDDVILKNMLEDDELTEGEIKDFERILTRELAVIGGVVALYGDSYPGLPYANSGDKYASYAVRRWFDWDIYVIFFSSFSKNDMINMGNLFNPE